MTAWKTEICSSRPSELQEIGPNLLIQRRNIRLVTVPATAETASYSQWECESREITVSEREMLLSIQEIDVRKAIDDYTLELMEGGVI